VVSSLINSYPDTFVALEMHVQFDGYETPWGNDRLDYFYGGWAGTAIPVILYDGFWYPLDIGDYEADLLDQMEQPTDVTIEITGSETSTAEYMFTSEVCVEETGVAKGMRIYTAQALDDYPNPPSYSRNTLIQVAPTEDVVVEPGQCVQVETEFQFGDESWFDREKIKIIVWAQETADVGPAAVFQAAQIGWPFPEGGGTIEPEYPRDFDLPVPLFVAPFSAWIEDAGAADVADGNALQIGTTYRVLCGDTSGLYPVNDPPTTDSPFPMVAYDEGAIPISGAGGGQQTVLVCDYDGRVRTPNDKWGVDTEGGPIQVPRCVGTVRPAGPEGLDSGGHLVMYDPVTLSEYDFWQTTTQTHGECLSDGGGIPGLNILETGQADIFEVKGTGANAAGVWGARAAATPLLAGLILPEDIEGGILSHALAVAVPGLRNLSTNPDEPHASDYHYPASFTQTERYNITPTSLAAGQRIRLKSTVVDSVGNVIPDLELKPITRMVFSALRNYGAYLVDSADGFHFFAEDVHTAVLLLDDDAINQLIGEPLGTPLPAGNTRWQVVIEALNEDLALVPFATGPCDGVSSVVEVANFEVIDGATAPPASNPAPRRPTGRVSFSAP